jgi:hypothetical protein
LNCSGSTRVGFVVGTTNSGLPWSLFSRTIFLEMGGLRTNKNVNAVLFIFFGVIIELC